MTTSSVTVPYRIYNVAEGQLYKKPSSGGNKGLEFNYTFTLKEADQAEKLEYTAVEGVNNVVFLAEAEDIPGMTPCVSANIAIRSSNAGAAYPAEDVDIVTLSAGTYELHIATFDATKGGSDMTYTFLADGEPVAVVEVNGENYKEANAVSFTLETAATLAVAQNGSATKGLDWIYITGTDTTTGIASAVTSNAVKSVRMYNLAGQQVEKATGIVLIQTIYADGTTETRRAIVK